MWVAIIKSLILEKNTWKVPKLHWSQEPEHANWLCQSSSAQRLSCLSPGMELRNFKFPTRTQLKAECLQCVP